MTGKEKKIQRRKNKEGLPKFYTKVQNLRTKYIKLVPKKKAHEMIYGILDILGERHKTHKDDFAEVV